MPRSISCGSVSSSAESARSRSTDANDSPSYLHSMSRAPKHMVSMSSLTTASNSPRRCSTEARCSASTPNGATTDSSPRSPAAVRMSRIISPLTRPRWNSDRSSSCCRRSIATSTVISPHASAGPTVLPSVASTSRSSSAMSLYVRLPSVTAVLMAANLSVRASPSSTVRAPAFSRRQCSNCLAGFLRGLSMTQTERSNRSDMRSIASTTSEMWSADPNGQEWWRAASHTARALANRCTTVPKSMAADMRSRSARTSRPTTPLCPLTS